MPKSPTKPIHWQPLYTCRLSVAWDLGSAPALSLSSRSHLALFPSISAAHVFYSLGFLSLSRWYMKPLPLDFTYFEGNSEDSVGWSSSDEVPFNRRSFPRIDCGYINLAVAYFSRSVLLYSRLSCVWFLVWPWISSVLWNSPFDDRVYTSYGFFVEGFFFSLIFLMFGTAAMISLY